MTTKFARCFPLGDGKMCCEHWNGSYIIFPMRRDYKKQKSPSEVEIQDEPSVNKKI